MYDDRATALSSQAFRERRLWRSMRRTTDPQRSTRRIRNSYREKYRTIVKERSWSQAIRTSEFLRVRVIAVRNVDKSKVIRSLVSTPRWTLCRPSCRLSLPTSLSRWRLLPPKPLEKWPTNEDVAVQVGFISDWKQCGSHCFVTHDAAVCKNVETLWYRLKTKERSTMMASTPKSDKHGGKFPTINVLPSLTCETRVCIFWQTKTAQPYFTSPHVPSHPHLLSIEDFTSKDNCFSRSRFKILFQLNRKRPYKLNRYLLYPYRLFRSSFKQRILKESSRLLFKNALLSGQTSKTYVLSLRANLLSSIFFQISSNYIRNHGWYLLHSFQDGSSLINIFFTYSFSLFLPLFFLPVTTNRRYYRRIGGLIHERITLTDVAYQSWYAFWSTRDFMCVCVRKSSIKCWITY